MPLLGILVPDDGVEPAQELDAATERVADPRSHAVLGQERPNEWRHPRVGRSACRTCHDGRMRRETAAIGSAVFFAAAPGVVVGLVPWLLTGWDLRFDWPLPVRVAGLVLLVLGVAGLVQAFVRFVVEGLGTPSPIAPTERLVVGGWYRYVRNPMYVAVVTAIVGQALWFGQPVLLGYAALAWAVVAAFVRWYEEPNLTRRFGEDYRAYRAAVPGWIPRLRPWDPESR